MRLHEIPRTGATDSSPASPILPAPSWGISIRFSGTPHPARAFAGRLPRHFYRHPPPRPRLRQRRPMQFADTLTPPAFPREYPYSSAGLPHPTRACGAPPPPPPGGGVRAWRYLVGSRVRGAAGGPPCPVFLQDLPVHWTVGISPRGVGPTGRGNSFPLPCLLRSKYLTSPASPTPPAP